MKQFRVSPPGYSAQLEPAEAVLLAGAMEELAEAFGAEAGRDYVAQMVDEGLGLDQSTTGFGGKTGRMWAGLDRDIPPLTAPNEHTSGQERNNDASQTQNLNAISSRRGHYRRNKDSFSDPRLADTPAGSEEEVLAALDFEPLPPRPEPENPVVAAIIRPLSSDAEVAAELRALTMPGMCQQKRSALLNVAAEIRRAGRQGNLVRVSDATLGQWLSALNDLRLSLGWALNITDDERAEQVQALATRGAADGNQDEVSEYEQGLAGLYTALSWWLETLLACVDSPEHPGMGN